MTTTEIKPGTHIKYSNYGAVKLGKVIRTLGTEQVLIIRLDGPMSGSTTWIHKQSIAE